MIIDSPVFPVVPSYDKDGKLEHPAPYLEYLFNNGAIFVMTTAGTSQFNLLSEDEVYKLNDACIKRVIMGRRVIMGLKPNWMSELKCDIQRYSSFQDSRYAFLLQYPERYYSDQEIINYFNEAADFSHLPIFIHCLPLRNGRGKCQYIWTADLINKLCEHDNIIGIKEETPDLMQAYDICSKINTDNCQIICAGGSQRRFELLKNVSVQSFLSGVGSIYPQIDIEYYKKIDSCISDQEDTCFDIFFKIGWHPALRYALKRKGLISYYDRQPYYELAQAEKSPIDEWVDEMDKIYNA